MLLHAICYMVAFYLSLSFFCQIFIFIFALNLTNPVHPIPTTQRNFPMLVHFCFRKSVHLYTVAQGRCIRSHDDTLSLFYDVCGISIRKGFQNKLEAGFRKIKVAVGGSHTPQIRAKNQDLFITLPPPPS
jgi:hypothetical protein